MSKANQLLSRFGGNLAESMGAGRESAKPSLHRAEQGTGITSGPTRHDGVNRLKTAAEIEVERIISDPNQPRDEFEPEAIDRLAESLKTHGQIQPIAVRWVESLGRYVIVAGERRWRASVQAGRKTIAAVVLEGDRTEGEILELQIIENCLREDLRPIEQARAFKALMDRNGWSAVRLGETLRLNNSTIIRALALLDLPSTVQSQVETGQIAPSVAYEVSKLDNAVQQAEVAARVVAEGLTRADVAQVVKGATNKLSGTKTKGRGPGKPPKPRTFKLAGGRVVIEPKYHGLEAMLALVEEAANQLRAMIGPSEQDAA
jgi:ParB family chromosome partitioning protein